MNAKGQALLLRQVIQEFVCLLYSFKMNVVSPMLSKTLTNLQTVSSILSLVSAFMPKPLAYAAT